MEKTLPLRRRKTSTEKARILAACAQSQSCNRDFAAQHGIALSTFYRWQQQLSTGQRADRAHLIEVPNLLSSAPAPRTYRVQLANGTVLEIASGFVPRELRSLTQLIQGL